MSRIARVNLAAPVKSGTRTIRELKLRAPLPEDAQAVYFNARDPDSAVRLLARIANVKVDVVRHLSDPDYEAVKLALAGAL